MNDVIEAEVRDLTMAPQPPALWGTTDPADVVAKATETAKALADVVRSQKLTSNIQGREYVRCEGWTLLGSMLGVFRSSDKTRAEFLALLRSPLL